MTPHRREWGVRFPSGTEFEYDDEEHATYWCAEHNKTCGWCDEQAVVVWRDVGEWTPAREVTG